MDYFDIFVYGLMLLFWSISCFSCGYWVSKIDSDIATEGDKT